MSRKRHVINGSNGNGHHHGDNGNGNGNSSSVLDLSDRKIASKIRKKNKLYGFSPRNKSQEKFLEIISEKDMVFFLGYAGTGKTYATVSRGVEAIENGEAYRLVLVRPAVEANGEKIGFLPGPQPLDANILTPNGWIKMKDIHAGDMVISDDGKPTKVLKVFPMGEKQIYRITTDDGCSTKASDDHLWFTQTFKEKKRGKSGEIRTTKDILETLFIQKNKKKSISSLNHSLPRVSAIKFNECQLPFPPYTLGVLLGDGDLTNKISIINTDKEIIKRVSDELKDLDIFLYRDKNSIQYRLISSSIANNKTARPLRILNIDNEEEVVFSRVGEASAALNMNSSTINYRCNSNSIFDGKKYEFLPYKNRWQNKAKEILYKLGLQGKSHLEKFIPHMYIYSASINDRLDLLKGLIDTDGSIGKKGDAVFFTTSKQLAKDVACLVRSLGGRSNIKLRDRRNKYSSEINGRKIFTKEISYEVSISLPVGMNPSFLKRKSERYKNKYMHSQKIKSIEFVGKKETQCILIENKSHLYVTDDFILTHNTKEEKMEPYLQSVFDILYEYWSPEEIQDKIANRIIEISPLAYMRGRSLTNAYVILEEAQNVTRDQMEMFVTRIGENSKFVITGDIRQSDIKNQKDSGLIEAAEIFKDIKEIEFIYAGKDEVVRHPLVEKLVKRYEEIKEKRQ